jgi:hypothetical protein
MIGMEGWEYHDISFEGQTKKVNGVNIWQYQWHQVDTKGFNAPHPQHVHQSHLFVVYCVNTNGNKTVFAASEVSNTVWCIYVPK